MNETTLCYLIRDDKWLMLYRNSKKDDINLGKWIGVGGKIEEGETPLQCISREINEETGLIANNLQYRGTVHFYVNGSYDEKIRVYTCEDFEGSLTECSEGKLEWIPKERILNLSLWEGDRIFLMKLLQDDREEFEFDLFYDNNGKLVKAEERRRKSWENRSSSA